MPKQNLDKKTVQLPLVNSRKNPHWKELSEAPFNQPATGKRYEIGFRVKNPFDETEREWDIAVLVSRVENRSGLHVFVTGIVTHGTEVPGLGYCGAKTPMRFKIKYDYENHEGMLEITRFKNNR